MKLIRALLTLPIVVLMEIGMLIIMLLAALGDTAIIQTPKGYQSIKKHFKLIAAVAKGDC